METETQKQIRLIRERSEASDKKRQKTRANTRLSQVQKDAGIFYRFWVQLVIAVFWIWQKIVRPVSWFVFWRPFWWAFGIYKNVWSFFVYKRDQFGDLKFSKVRAGLFLIVSIPMLFSVSNLALDSVIFGLTYKPHEVMYLFNSTDNSFDDKDQFSVTGCEKKSDSATTGFVCDSEDTLYFRVDGTWFEHLWSVFNKGHIFYSDSIGSAIAPGWNECVTSSWYFRIKILYRNTNFYPHLLAATCRPVATGVN